MGVRKKFKPLLALGTGRAISAVTAVSLKEMLIYLIAHLLAQQITNKALVSSSGQGQYHAALIT